MMKKILLEHMHGASIIGLGSDDNLKNETFLKYIKPIAKVYKVHPKKYKRISDPYSRRHACPVQIFELLTPQ
jgi:hypothetical protein